MSTENMLTAYNVKTKEKNVPIHDAVVSRTAKGGYIAKGNDGKGNKLTALLGEAKVLEAIKEIGLNGKAVANMKDDDLKAFFVESSCPAIRANVLIAEIRSWSQMDLKD